MTQEMLIYTRAYRYVEEKPIFPAKVDQRLGHYISILPLRPRPASLGIPPGLSASQDERMSITSMDKVLTGDMTPADFAPGMMQSSAGAGQGPGSKFSKAKGECSHVSRTATRPRQSFRFPGSPRERSMRCAPSDTESGRGTRSRRKLIAWLFMLPLVVFTCV